ncbi:Bacterial transcription activator, effector binding domain [Poriferisphaera corsica]|uniref:Bacterial transcription activator, effector binding domain n=1 Tax=Poriferisphaera corsica TaxID=2528020 RepID=A0A517YQ45_9BACT|nr:GyrI-like domain-containing protein [Poriferisphaera corsica]QDU32354.1 Bacterial transcription activator, effector binding domain [Poriferisphaera corsica]
MAQQTSFIIKDTPNYTALCHTRDITFAQIPEVAGEVIPQIWEHALNKLDTCTAGPVVFSYEPSEKPDHIQLTIAIPIVPKDGLELSSSDYQIKHYPPAKVASTEHPGSMTTIGQSWEKLFQSTKEAGLNCECGNGREIYTHWISHESPDNRTEIQALIMD